MSEMLMQLIIKRLEVIDRKCDRLIEDVTELKDRADEQDQVKSMGGRY